MRPPRPITRPSRLAPCAAAQRAGLAITQEAAAMVIASGLATRCAWAVSST